jgi:hypothetical protein
MRQFGFAQFGGRTLVQMTVERAGAATCEAAHAAVGMAEKIKPRLTAMANLPCRLHWLEKRQALGM